MKSQKRAVLLALAMVVVLGMYSVCVFAIVDNRTSTLWIAYGFTLLAIIVEFSLPMILGADSDIKKVTFLSISPVVITTGYFLIQLIAGIILIASNAPTKLSLILCIAIAAVYLLIAIFSIMGKSHIADVETDISTSTASIKAMTAKVEIALANEDDEIKKTALQKLYEALRFSDPRSTTDEIRVLDASIMAKVIEICESEERDPDSFARQIDRAIKSIQERNILCKASKV